MQDISYIISFNPEINTFLQGGGNLGSHTQYEIRQFLQGFTTVNSEIAGILLINSEGYYISNEMYAQDFQVVTDEEWYRTAVENNGIFKIIGHPENRSFKTHVNYQNSEIVSGARAILDPETQT